MAEFINPFSGMAPDRKLTNRELARAIRLALAAEQEAVHLYEALADASDNPLAVRVLLPGEERLLKKGTDEVQEMAQESDK